MWRRQVSFGIWVVLYHMWSRRKEMFYVTMHSTHFIYGYMASDIWLRTTQIAREETRCRHIGYSFRLAARVLLYAPSHRQDSTYHSFCYTSRGALAGMRNNMLSVSLKHFLPSFLHIGYARDHQSSPGPTHHSSSSRRRVLPWHVM